MGHFFDIVKNITNGGNPLANAANPITASGAASPAPTPPQGLQAIGQGILGSIMGGAPLPTTLAQTMDAGQAAATPAGAVATAGQPAAAVPAAAPPATVPAPAPETATATTPLSSVMSVGTPPAVQSQPAAISQQMPSAANYLAQQIANAPPQQQIEPTIDDFFRRLSAAGGAYAGVGQGAQQTQQMQGLTGPRPPAPSTEVNSPHDARLMMGLA